MFRWKAWATCYISWTISDNVDVFQVESLKVEAARECKAAQDQITTTYKLELMKMPKQVIVFTGTPPN